MSDNDDGPEFLSIDWEGSSGKGIPLWVAILIVAVLFGIYFLTK